MTALFFWTAGWCKSARGPDADRHAMVLIITGLEASHFGA